MRRFVRSEIRTYLKALDRHVPKDFTLVIIGGAAAALSFGAKGGTVDIDTTNKVQALAAACGAARKETGLAIPLGRASVYDAPRKYESRLHRLRMPEFRKLAVLVPEKHDWALMKVARFEDKDAEHIKAASESVGFDEKILKERFLSEMTHIQPRPRLVIHFLAMMEELFGELEADRTQQEIQSRKDWR